MATQFALITGCSEGGIGSALALAFQERGIRVFATARDISKMSHLAKVPNVTLLKLEPTVQDSVQAVAERVKYATDGKLDYLINNAGQTIMMPTLDFDVERAKAMYDINVWGTIRVTQAFSAMVIAAKGNIINICSIATSVHTPWMGIYTGSKAAVTSITDALRLELAPLGVKVFTVHTGAISTNTLSTGQDFHLPEKSVYKEIETQIAARARGEDGTPRMTPSKFADKVVADVVSGSSYQIWRGGYASIVRFTSSWFPAFVSDLMSIKGTGLDQWKPYKT